ncbi:DOMON domain-containing protein [Pontixanthobacter aquaemixtae]|uniref:DOMON-like domain-containing protein n=1 Tax=Pontixanthobacter aquaemixtae TaxID=1958940 RepID=A0A844ZPD5_9SPHN|nr:hypothetical protein [Pontixanthobacter aquaemixtae]MXO90221.1 hypothetical protein [Pontixanthobacter aquaemixtae]
MHPLLLHPDCAEGPVKAVSADIETTSGGCRARFRLQGDIAAIKVPPHAASARADHLWKTTCLEIFWQPHGGKSYREFNLSPSSRWASYDFDDYRLNSRDAAVDAIAISTSRTDSELVLEASIASDLPVPADIALTAIVEDAEGTIQYWALAFADGKPDFHNTTCRMITLENRL